MGTLSGMMFFYEVCRYGLVEEMITKKKWTRKNVSTFVFGATIGAGLFIFSVHIAIALLKRMGAGI
jgi:hypothetical protein